MSADADFYLPIYDDPYRVPGISAEMPLLPALALMQRVNDASLFVLGEMERQGWRLTLDRDPLGEPLIVTATRDFPDIEAAANAEAWALGYYLKLVRDRGLVEHAAAVEAKRTTGG